MGQDSQQSRKGEKVAARQARLADALRANLRKRKRQTRARKGGNEDSEPKPGED